MQRLSYATALKTYRTAHQMQIKEAQGNLGMACLLSTPGTFHAERINVLMMMTLRVEPLISAKSLLTRVSRLLLNSPQARDPILPPVMLLVRNLTVHNVISTLVGNI